MTHADESWRAAAPVLVADSHSVAGIAAIRSLGRAGYPVHACSPDRDALGFRSRYAIRGAHCPGYADPSFVPWLRRYLRDYGIRVMVPGEGMLLAVRPVFKELSPLLPVSDREDIVYAGVSKYDLYERLQSSPDRSVSDHLPPTLLITRKRGVSASELRDLPRPIFIKTDTRYGIGEEAGGVYPAQNVDEAMRQIEGLLQRFDRLKVQGFVPGLGAGAFFLRWNGEIRAEFMNVCLHETPHTGGYCSLRQSWRHEAMYRDALKKLERMEWQGVAMIEYRWERESERFWAIEMNARFWASLHLALFCGVDFPRLLVDTFLGHPQPMANEYPLGVLCRNTYPWEVQHVWSLLKDERVRKRKKALALGEFVWLHLRPDIYADMSFPEDRGLYLERLKRFVRTRS
jgi:predicted ATP-grasp superfamily ATP-dependent carboligase